MLERSRQNTKAFPALLLLLALAPFTLAAKGCDVATVGEDGCAEGETCDGDGDTSCGGLSGEVCAEGEYCDYPQSASCGAADATGVCRIRPQACTEEYAPVCGCDDQTYGNACAAQAAGVSAAHEGECAAAGATCGGLLGQACAGGEFCSYGPDAQCGAGDATGVCTPIPQACDDLYMPVCGCDERTYANTCEANGAGVSVAHAGECGAPEPNAETCGGLLGQACAGGEFCKYAPEAQCGAADATGVCTALPDACDANYDPVCGCDGETYGNECEANMAGTSAASAGACDEPPVGQTCGGFIGAGCPEGQYCNYSEAAQCGAGDATGVCAPIAEGCITVYDPVCGCDGKTYGNDCEAAAAAVSVASTGECP